MLLSVTTELSREAACLEVSVLSVKVEDDITDITSEGAIGWRLPFSLSWPVWKDWAFQFTRMESKTPEGSKETFVSVLGFYLNTSNSVITYSGE